MAASRTRERRTALWPYLAMPVIVLLVYYTLNQLRQDAGDAPQAPASTTGTDARP